MEKILSFDVGIIHLAYCFFTKKFVEEDKYVWDILDWAIIDLTDREEHKCSMCHKSAKVLQIFSGNKYYCKVHSKNIPSKPKPFEDFFKSLEKKQIGGCAFKITDEELCNKNCTLQMQTSDGKSYCLPHAKKFYSNLENEMKMKSLKNTSVKDLDFDDTRLKLVMELEKRKHLLEANVVVIENQPSFKNPRMKSISGIIYDYYMIRGMVDKAITKSLIKKVKFMSPSNKIKLASDGETQQLVKLKSSDESKAYKMTKSLAVKYATEMCKHLPEWLAKFNSHKKKDDLADAFLQGAYYFEMNVKVDNDENKVYKKKVKDSTKEVKDTIKEVKDNIKEVKDTIKEFKKNKTKSKENIITIDTSNKEIVI